MVVSVSSTTIVYEKKSISKKLKTIKLTLFFL